MQFFPVKDMDEVVKIAFGKSQGSDKQPLPLKEEPKKAAVTSPQ